MEVDLVQNDRFHSIAYNLLGSAWVSLCWAEEEDWKSSGSYQRSVGAKGKIDRIEIGELSPLWFAHTPDALENVTEDLLMEVRTGIEQFDHVVGARKFG